MVNIGIVGLGRIAEAFHIPSLQQIPEARIRALCARTATKERLALASLVGASFYESYQKMIDSETLDAVYICSPTVYHKQMALAAFRKGCHVFCEKPIAMKIEDAEAMCHEAHRNNRLLVVGYNRRFSPTYQRVKGFSEENKVSILLLEKTRGAFVNTSKAAYDEKAKREAKALGPDIMEFGVHFVDLAKWIGGRVVKAYFTGSKIAGVEASLGSAVAVFDHAQGQRSILYFSLAGGKSMERSTAIADEGTCETFGGMFGISTVLITKGGQAEEFPSPREVLEAGGFLQENRDFIDSVQHNKCLADKTEDIIDSLLLTLRWAGCDKA